MTKSTQPTPQQQPSTDPAADVTVQPAPDQDVVVTPPEQQQRSGDTDDSEPGAGPWVVCG